MLKIETNIEFTSLGALVQKALEAIPVSNRYVIALSGGLDSIALLHFFIAYLTQGSAAQSSRRSWRDLEIIPLHIHHGLNIQADSWAKYCVQECKKLGLECQVESVQVVSSGQGLEAAARKVRYEVFERYLQDGGVLLQGHHQNDQAETVLMRMLRGAGPEGLAGIPQSRAIAHGRIYRPWLELPRKLLQREVENNHLNWIEDDSNNDLAFDRNYIRHQVMPLLEKRWSTTLNSLSMVAQKSCQANAQITAWCRDALDKVMSDQYHAERAICLDKLCLLDEEYQRTLLRYWLNQWHIGQPSNTTFERVWSELIPAETSSQPIVQWGQHQLRRYDGCLFYLTVGDSGNKDFAYQLDNPLEQLPISFEVGSQQLLIEYLPQGRSIPPNAVLLKIPSVLKALRVIARQGGESIRPSGAAQTKSLKKLYQEHGLAPWKRAEVPLLYFDGDLVYVGVPPAGFAESTSVAVVANGFESTFGQDALAVSLFSSDT